MAGLAPPFAICECVGMEQTLTQFAEAAGISTAYASEIVNGKRSPSLSVALFIHQRTGKAFGPIAEMSPEAIDALSHLAAPPKPRGRAAA